MKYTTVSSLATAQAERGLFSITAISPNQSPGPTCANTSRTSWPTSPEISTHAFLHHVNPVALVPFLEDFLARRELLLAGDLAQSLQLRRVELIRTACWLQASPCRHSRRKPQKGKAICGRAREGEHALDGRRAETYSVRRWWP